MIPATKNARGGFGFKMSTSFHHHYAVTIVYLLKILGGDLQITIFFHVVFQDFMYKLAT